jgi:hypothetical protein
LTSLFYDLKLVSLAGICRLTITSRETDSEQHGS